MTSRNNDHYKLAKQARSQGWSVEVTGGNHLAWKAPGGAVIFSPSTAGDCRNLRNLRARLRRAGLDIPRR